MKHGTGIQWTWVPGYKGETWNPTIGCTRVSAGCDQCYAFSLHDRRYATNLRAARDMGVALSEARRVRTTLPLPAQYDQPFSQVQLLPDRLDQPLHWRKPRAVFVCSMADLFHEQVPHDYLDRVFATMALTPQHIYMVLTKRPKRMLDYCSAPTGLRGITWRYGAIYNEMGRLGREMKAAKGEHPFRRVWPDGMPWPLPNVWLGTSVENQKAFDERWPHLRDTPAAVRFISYEPALGPLDASEAMLPTDFIRGHPTLGWVIVGGESGPKARPMQVEWARSIRDQCEAAGIAFFFKQWSGPRPQHNATLDGVKHHNWPEVRR